VHRQVRSVGPLHPEVPMLLRRQVRAHAGGVLWAAMKGTTARRSEYFMNMVGCVDVFCVWWGSYCGLEERKCALVKAGLVCLQKE